MFADPSSQSAFCALADASHAQLAGTLAELACTHDAAKRRAGWQQLESALLSHLRAEEELLLSEFDLALPADTVRIREEHQRVRQGIADASAAADAGHVDPTLLHDLGDRLRSCATHEERVLYPWAESFLRPRKKREFLQRAQLQTVSSGSRGTPKG